MVAISRLGRGVRGRGLRGARGFMAPVDRRVPSPALAALRRRVVLGRGVAWDTAALLGSPIMGSRRAV